jgi:hypothetical protein
VNSLRGESTLGLRVNSFDRRVNFFGRVDLPLAG